MAGRFSRYNILAAFGGRHFQIDQLAAAVRALDNGLIRGMKLECGVPILRSGGQEEQPAPIGLQ